MLLIRDEEVQESLKMTLHIIDTELHYKVHLKSFFCWISFLLIENTILQGEKEIIINSPSVLILNLCIDFWLTFIRDLVVLTELTLIHVFPASSIILKVCLSGEVFSLWKSFLKDFQFQLLNSHTMWKAYNVDIFVVHSILLLIFVSFQKSSPAKCHPEPKRSN